jgi:hypothetical protein
MRLSYRTNERDSLVTVQDSPRDSFIQGYRTGLIQLLQRMSISQLRSHSELRLPTPLHLSYR